MILVDVFRDEDGIKQIKMSGHSGYEEVGKDIVCAAASTLMFHTMNLLEGFKIDFEKEIDESIPLISIVIKSHDNTSDILLNTLVKDLNDVSQGYKKFIKIKENRR